jgi:hypothetical protein
MTHECLGFLMTQSIPRMFSYYTFNTFCKASFRYLSVSGPELVDFETTKDDQRAMISSAYLSQLQGISQLVRGNIPKDLGYLCAEISG